jgi:hypothetical protein
MSSLLLFLIAIVAIFGAFVKAAAPVTGAIVAARLRCQGYLCPQWALDIGRYNTIRTVGDEYQWVLQELLPLAPTSQRSMRVYTSYDEATRTFTVSAADYPAAGIDSYWVSTINDDILGTTPILSNVMVPHPDASPNNPGSVSLSGIYTMGTQSVAVFNDGCVHLVDIKGQKYTKVANLLDSVADSTKVYTITQAHVIDGQVLKSFIMNANGDSFLVTVDLSASPAKVTAPVRIQRIQGELGASTPMGAFKYSIQGPSVPPQAPQLMLQAHGNFDTISFINETTGEQTPAIANMAVQTVPNTFVCNTGSKDCDMWQTAAIDSTTGKFYFQSHVIQGDDTFDVAMLDMFYVTSAIDSTPYPVINPAMDPMQFGYMGYQYVQIKQ